MQSIVYGRFVIFDIQLFTKHDCFIIRVEFFDFFLKHGEINGRRVTLPTEENDFFLLWKQLHEAVDQIQNKDPCSYNQTHKQPPVC